MIRFAEAWPDQPQVTALAQHLGWSHFKEILYLENELARQFYAEMCRVEPWSVLTLRDREPLSQPQNFRQKLQPDNLRGVHAAQSIAGVDDQFGGAHEARVIGG
jgi:DUF1016 N-terminal domain